MTGIFWLASYPKSGNTWLRAFIRNLQAGADVPVDINSLQLGAIASARPWLDHLLGADTADFSADEIDRLRPALHAWAAQESTIVDHVKIHDALRVAPGAAPIVGGAGTLGAVYLVRNPLDVALSSAHHWHCSVDAAIARMADPGAALARDHRGARPQVRQRMLSWSGHVRSWIDADDFPLRVARYEDMLADGPATFGALARFLGLPADEAAVARAMRHSDFRELARQEAAAGFAEKPARSESFFRQGRAGGWRERLSAAQVQRVVADHGDVMQRLGYLDERGDPA